MPLPVGCVPYTASVSALFSYPHRPPSVRFVTPVYHPNIDEQGRVCLDSLNLPPKGMWSPLLTIEALLLSIQQLMAHPNGSDGLSKEATEAYNSNRAEWERRARDMTAQHAVAGKKAQQVEELKTERRHAGEAADKGKEAEASGASDGKRKREEESTVTGDIDGVDERVEKRAKAG